VPLSSLREVFAYQGRLVGPRSALRILRNLFGLPKDYRYEDPNLPIEVAFANVLLNGDFKISDLATLGIEGEQGSPCQSTSVCE